MRGERGERAEREREKWRCHSSQLSSAGRDPCRLPPPCRLPRESGVQDRAGPWRAAWRHRGARANMVQRTGGGWDRSIGRIGRVGSGGWDRVSPPGKGQEGGGGRRQEEGGSAPHWAEDLLA
jgi:hypothetical protein